MESPRGIEDPQNAALPNSGGGQEEGEHHVVKQSLYKRAKAKAKKMKESFKGQKDDVDDTDDLDDDVDDDNNVQDGGHEINLDDHAAHPGKEEITSQHDETNISNRAVSGDDSPVSDLGKEGITSQHDETNISNRAVKGDDSPVSDLGTPVSDLGTNQAFDVTPTNNVPGEEETLGWSRTDNTPTNTPVIGQSTGSQSTGGIGVVPKPKLGGIFEKDHHRYVDDIELEQGGETPRQHEGNLDQGATIEGASSHTSESDKPVEYQTFDTTSSIYIPGEVETLGRSRTDSGGSKLSEEQTDSPENTPGLDSRGHYHTETGEMEKFDKHEDSPSILEKDPHASRVDVGENLHAENYQTEVTDPTGRGAEEIEGTPILHELEKMNIHDESTEKHDLNTGQQEDKHISIGNHDQFSPEAVTKPQLDATIPTSQGFHDDEEQKPGSYNDKVSRETPTNELGKMNIHDESAGNHDQFSFPESVSTKPQFDATIPNSQGFHDEEKQKPESYNDKIPYDSSTNADSTVSVDQQPDQDSLDTKPVAGGYGEKVSSISSSITNTAGLAKDAVASKLGYGKTDEEQSGPEYQAVSPDSSSSDKVINEALPVHNKTNEETPIDEATKVNEEKKVVVKAEDTDSGTGLASPGKSVMDRLRDAAGSWL